MLCLRPRRHNELTVGELISASLLSEYNIYGGKSPLDVNGTVQASDKDIFC